MSLHERLTELIQACFTGVWIESHEHEDALREIAQLCRDQDWRLATWNLETGLTIPGAETPPATTGQDPLAASDSEHRACRGDSVGSCEQVADLGQRSLLERRSARDLSVRDKQAPP